MWIHIQTCADLCVDMCVDMYIYVCRNLHLRMHMCIHMCVGMCIRIHADRAGCELKLQMLVAERQHHSRVDPLGLWVDDNDTRSGVARSIHAALGLCVEHGLQCGAQLVLDVPAVHGQVRGQVRDRDWHLDRCRGGCRDTAETST